MAGSARVLARAPGEAPYRWPLDGSPAVVRPFDPPAARWLAGHRGVDLAATPGAVVRAAGAGSVHFAGRVVDRGVVSVDHPNGLRTTYEPVEPTVRTGEIVSAGAPIGVLMPGHAGCPAPACLHWGLRSGSVYLDPLALLGQARVRLLPSPLAVSRLPARSGRARLRAGLRGSGPRGWVGQPSRVGSDRARRSYSSGRL
nr:M23 family metallopeptidase [Micromonospora sp. NBRC 107566]